MSSSPALQPQHGAGGKSVVDELADETVVEDEPNSCADVTPVGDVDKSCDVQLPVDMSAWSSTDSESTGISEKFPPGN